MSDCRTRCRAWQLSLLAVVFSVGIASGCGQSEARPPTDLTAVAGEVLEVSGSVVARAGEQERVLAVGDEVAGQDEIATGPDGAVKIRLFHNRALWALGPDNTRQVSESAAWRAPRSSGGEVFAQVERDRTAAAGRHGERQAAETGLTGLEADRESAGRGYVEDDGAGGGESDLEPSGGIPEGALDGKIAAPAPERAASDSVRAKGGALDLPEPESAPESEPELPPPPPPAPRSSDPPPRAEAPRAPAKPKKLRVGGSSGGSRARRGSGAGAPGGGGSERERADGAAKPRVVTTVSVGAGLPESAIEARIASAHARLARCYPSAPAGELVITAVIAVKAAGRPAAVTVRGPASVRSCVQRELARLSFPAPAGDEARVTVTVRLSSE